jgi:hypothetical protein
MLVGNSNLGWQPNSPDQGPTLVTYTPVTTPAYNAWEPPARSQTGTDTYFGRFAWTRGGLRGVDYGGGEIDTGQN